MQGEIRQLVEVKLNVVQAAPASSHALPSDGVIDVEANEIKDSEDKTSIRPMPRMRPASSTEMVRDLVTGMPVEFSFMVTGSGSDTLTFFETDGPGFMALDDVSLTAATPLPAALPLFATGLGGLGLLGWRRKRKAQAV